MFKALVLQNQNSRVSASVESLDESALPAGNVTVAVAYSTLNYKDGMILKGLGNIVRQYPHVPGIDFVGAVAESTDPRYKPGDKVILTGWRVGETHWGGYAQTARVNADWLVPLPDGLTPRRAMAIGTAGLTAMLAIMSLEEHGLTPSSGQVLVTGATGGVGGIAVLLLAAKGYDVAASTGKAESHDWLRELGARTILPRSELTSPARPLEKERWAACIDNVGGPSLAHVLAHLKWHGSVAAVGLAGGNTLNTTLLPFLLRGVNLLGIDSNACPTPRRLTAWSRLVAELDMATLDRITQIVPLGQLPAQADRILAGQVQGRTVIDVNAEGV